MTKAFFVTGTDTEVGKTYCTVAMMRAVAAAGASVVGYKPIAAGCEWKNGRWENEDAVALQQASTVNLELRDVNPIALEHAIAPHIAADIAGTPIDEVTIVNGFQHLMSLNPDYAFVEGAGGWRLPLGGERYLSSVVQDLNLDVILVVGLRLGCLNHAILTAETIIADGLRLKGWVANQLSADMPLLAENIASLERLMPAPLLTTVPFRCEPDLVQISSSLGCAKVA